MTRAKTYHVNAIVLDRTKLGESDLILRLLCADGSQVSAVAKGARKPSGKLAAKVQLFCECDFLLAKGRNLDVVAEAQLTCAHERLRGELERVSAASVVAEVAKLTSFEDSCDSYLYPICSRALTACEEAASVAHLDVVCAAYTFKVLAHQGWNPSLEVCVSCGEPSVNRFSCLAGGALCESCSKDIEGAELLDAATFQWLKTLIHATFDELLTMQISAEQSSFLVSLSHAWAATHLDCKLRAYEFMLGISY